MAEEEKAEEAKTEEAGDAGDDEEEKPKKKPKPKKPKAKTGKSEMGGTGEHADKTYEQIMKKDMEYVEGLLRSRDPLTNEEEDFVDWILNREDGRAAYQKFSGKGQGKCLAAAPCVIQ